jgi:hypothetical protein
MVRITWGSLLLGLAITTVANESVRPPAAPGDRAARAIREKNDKDFYALHRAIAIDPAASPSRAAESLKAAMACLNRLARGDEVDELRDASLAAHKDQWPLLLAAAQSLAEGHHSGDLIGGKFFRGWRISRTGKSVDCVERDRVLASWRTRGTESSVDGSCCA